ncbi:MAG: flagellin [Pseudomonadota bacterium]
MSLVVNHNMMAMKGARLLNNIYGSLAQSTERLSSGPRINSAADDAAGLAIRELMRSDITVLRQGIRNASDGISLIQTAEGAMSVIDEKLTRMKELAEQAATGTYTTVQREIMNSEYVAMAKEIDRIANATDFNGIKMLDGSLTALHQGSGLKIHFGTGNSAAEDYYYINIMDVRATSETGLHVGGDLEIARNDIWRSSTTWTSGASAVNTGSSAYVGFFYDFDTSSATGAHQTLSYLSGLYEVPSGGSLNDLVESINSGTRSRIMMSVSGASTVGDLALDSSSEGFALTIGTRTYGFVANTVGSAWAVNSAGADVVYDVGGSSGNMSIRNFLASAINADASADVYAVYGGDTNELWFFAKNSGTNAWAITEQAYDAAGGGNSAISALTWTNVSTGVNADTAEFSMGGLTWARARTQSNISGTAYYFQVEGASAGAGFDLETFQFGAQSAAITRTSGNFSLGGLSWSMTETQNASAQSSESAGAHIRTQSAAQEALGALEQAINEKDVIRANLGATQNRLENTITQLGIQAENLQASESRISDVDVVTEMTEFTKNNILAQAATAMLAQANSLPQLALSLLG